MKCACVDVHITSTHLESINPAHLVLVPRFRRVYVLVVIRLPPEEFPAAREDRVCRCIT